MLLKIREIVSGWLAAVIVIMLIIPFAFWGINYYFGSGGNVLALEVNGSPVTLQDYQKAYQNTRRRWQEIFGGSIEEEQEPVIRQNTLDALIERELIKDINASMGVRVSDKTLTETIKGISAFQGVNGFDDYLYEQTISRMGYTSSEFEQQMRIDLETAQLQGAILQSIFITNWEKNRIVSLMNQERDFRYAVISSEEIKDSIEVSDTEISNYYETHGREYMNPEQVRIAYVDLSLQKMSQEVQVSEDELQSYYDENKALYDVEDQRKFKHLYVAKEDGQTPEELEKIKADVQSVYDLVSAGQSFEDAVASIEDGSPANFEVIDQDYMTKGIMDPEVDEVLFSLQPGELSKPIETESGIHVIRLELIKGGKSTIFEDVRDLVEADYRKSKAEPEFIDKVDKMTNLAFEFPNTLDVISEELGLTVYESAFFDRQWQSNEFLRNPKIVNASFSEDVLDAGNNSEPIEIEDNRYVVLRVVEHDPEQKKPLDEVRDRIITRIKFEQGRDETRDIGMEIINKLRNKASPEEIAAGNDVEWQSAEAVKRDDPEIDSAILGTVFRLGRPEQDQVIYGGNSLASGDYTIVMVEAVRDADPADISEEELSTIRSRLENLRANDSWTQFIADLKARAKIHIYSDNL